ncbi:MAG: nucleotidyltransferase family protein [Nocardioides sp.]
MGGGAGLLRRLMELAELDVDWLARVLAQSPTYGSPAEVAELNWSVDAFVGATTRADAPRRRYDRDMSDASAPSRKPLGGPTGRRVAARRGELLDVLSRHGVTNPEIFGSAARGDDRETSDVDLLVDFRAGTDIIGIKRELEDVLGVPVDLVPRSSLKERVRSRAAKDLLPL